MRPDDPRQDIIQRIREVATILEHALPDTVLDELPHRFPALAALLLARIADQGRSVAALLEHGRDLDARMVMRSALEHLTLAAWLAIDVSKLPAAEQSCRTWRASTPDDNAALWVVDQLRRDKKRAEKQSVRLGDPLDEETRDAIRSISAVIRRYNRGEVPSMEAMAAEVDAAWGGRMPGWARIDPGQAEFMFTIQGMYWTLYQVGSASTHPGLRPLLDEFLEPIDGEERVARLVMRRISERVDSFASITAYLLLYATGVAEQSFGEAALDDALRALGRYDAVRGPDLLLQKVAKVLDEDGRRYGSSAALPVSVSRAGDRTSIVVVRPDGWLRLVHEPGPVWSLDGEHQPKIISGRSTITDDFASQICLFRDSLMNAEWDDDGSRWPGKVP